MEQLTTGRISLRRTGTYAGAPVAGFVTALHTRVMLFWCAFILTRPLGATVGDFLDKPVAKGGLDFSRPLATATLSIAIVLLILLAPQRAGRGHR